MLEAARFLANEGGFIIEQVPVRNEGLIDFRALERSINDSVLVFSAMAVNNEIGTIQDWRRIADLLLPHGILFHCDAAQAPCAVDLANIANFADLVSLSGHKIYGPKGIGALYVHREAQSRLTPVIHGGGQQIGLRSGTVPTPLCAGFAAAAEILNGPEAAIERDRVAKLRDQFVGLMRTQWPEVSVNGPKSDSKHPGIANLRFDGYNARDVLGLLQPQLAASTGAACTSGIPEPSHVLRAIGLNAIEADSSIRFSFGRFTTGAEVRDAVHLVATALKELEFQRFS